MQLGLLVQSDSSGTVLDGVAMTLDWVLCAHHCHNLLLKVPSDVRYLLVVDGVLVHLLLLVLCKVLVICRTMEYRHLQIFLRHRRCSGTRKATALRRWACEMAYPVHNELPQLANWCHPNLGFILLWWNLAKLGSLNIGLGKVLNG